ncbi:transposase [Azotobacter vinelandii CA]|uniref:Transposase n=2 Tax=Azotobacter vinelandii TaxID=354 RepID=C1DNJ5_AZOVD|nr:transposase [Azotobacter vinelandii DJ]AGK17139.1 transposase [Azotobacter vinelandii CA]AGK19641.1 transposase [Azotobacter vinelandii CA6]
MESVSLDSTIVKVHPDGTGARKKTGPNPSGAPEGAGPPKFIWLPRMIAASSPSP